MKKIMVAFLSICIPVIGININSNAKLVKRKWCSELKITNFGIYSLGCRLSDYKPYYLLRGKNWVYSGDTFGFEAGNEMKNILKQYDIKMQISVIKGIASKIKSTYIAAEDGSFEHADLGFTSRVYGSGDFWSIWDGKIYVKSKKGCTIQIKFSQKYVASNKWHSYVIKVKVKKRPLLAFI